MQTVLDDWFSRVVADHTGTSLYAPAAVAAQFPTVAGISVQVDNSIPGGSLELRGEDGSVMARYMGIQVPQPDTGRRRFQL